MREADIRCAVRDRLREIHADEPETVYREELGLCLGATRVDVAVINGAISGYEIKSAADTLTRFPAQVERYSSVLDHAVIVAEPKYVDRVAEMTPQWWGVWAITDDGAVTIQELRPTGFNPCHDALSVAQLLWRDEALSVLEERGMAHGVRSATRWALWDRLATLPIDELRHAVRTVLKARSEWPGG